MFFLPASWKQMAYRLSPWARSLQSWVLSSLQIQGEVNSLAVFRNLDSIALISFQPGNRVSTDQEVYSTFAKKSEVQQWECGGPDKPLETSIR